MIDISFGPLEVLYITIPHSWKQNVSMNAPMKFFEKGAGETFVHKSFSRRKLILSIMPRWLRGDADPGQELEGVAAGILGGGLKGLPDSAPVGKYRCQRECGT